MKSTTKPINDIYEFGEQLLRSNDLDPVYNMLWNFYGHNSMSSLVPSLDMQRWLLAYWCFYHAGSASWIVSPAFPGDKKDIANHNRESSEASTDFLKRLWIGAESKTLPRCTERRHFRGKNAEKSVEYIQRIGVRNLFKPLMKPQTAQQLIDYVKTWVGFGPWISFKVADMVERLAIAQINFETENLKLFDSPAEGAKLMWTRHNLGRKGTIPSDVTKWAVYKLCDKLSDYKAPPRFERPIGIQEAETILCKWKSHLSGHYEIGEDVVSLKKGLQNPVCRTTLGDTLLKHVPLFKE